MNPTLEDLKAEWEIIKAEVDSAKAAYDGLRQKRSGFYVTLLVSEASDPEAKVQLKQQAETEAKRWVFDLQTLDQEIQNARIKLRQIRAKLAVKQAQIYRIQAQQNWPKLKLQLERVNELSKSLKQEIQIFDQIAKDFHPAVEEWMPKHPQLVEFIASEIPYIEMEDKKFKLVNHPLDLIEE